MKYLIAMAFRNVRRNRRRSILAALSVGLAIMLVVLAQGFVGGILGSIVKNYTKNETGHVRIASQSFEEKYRFYPVTDPIENPSGIIESIRSDQEIRSKLDLVTERINFGVLLSHEGASKSAVALAGDAQKEKDLLMLQQSIRPGGRYIQGSREMIMGAKIADALDYELGDTVKVVTQGSDYALHMRKFAIVGIFQTGLNALDNSILQIPLQDARELLRMGDGTQQIILMLDDWRDAEDVARRIETIVGSENLAVTAWTEIGDYGRMVKMMSAVYQLIYWVIALLGAFIIGNIMMMVILERRKEIGILKSMGVSRKELLTLFIGEGSLLGLVGSIGGAAMGLAISIYFHIVGIDFSSSMGSLNFPMDNVIHFTISFAGIVQVMIIGTVVSALVSFGPSWKGARMNAVESIKSV